MSKEILKDLKELSKKLKASQKIASENKGMCRKVEEFNRLHEYCCVLNHCSSLIEISIRMLKRASE